mmetsp:Transcript_137905/g.440372  ORF Transcript_137905/g.440372 Transcript_137905/m.440372 type:complete len:323 (+) Transcript_137905:102-1070(+)
MSCFDCFCGMFGQGKEAKKRQALKTAKGLLENMIGEKSCGPILLRLAWHDAGTYDKNNAKRPWPNAGGAIGSIRTEHEITAPPNAGLRKALMSYLEPVKKQVPGLSWADLIQLGGACAVEQMGGPKINMRYGRVDGMPTELAAVPFGLPSALPAEGIPLYPHSKASNKLKSAAEHLRYVFYKYDMNDKDIVALSGAHTVGRAFKDRSDTVEEGYLGGTAYTKRGVSNLQKSKTAGGRSWTKNWLKFDNSYFGEVMKAFEGTKDPDVVCFPTDKCLIADKAFRRYCEDFAASEAAFHKAYAEAHKKLSELGCKFEPADGITDV